MGKLKELVDLRFDKKRKVIKLNDEIEKLDEQIDVFLKKLTRKLARVIGTGFDGIKIDDDGSLVIFLTVKDTSNVVPHFAKFGLTVVHQKFDSYGQGWVWLNPEEIANLKVVDEEIEL